MAIDVARGVAVAMMIAYHFSFDLNLMVGLGIDFNRDPRWIGWRTVIVTLFLLLVGVSQAVVHHHGLAWGRYARRLAVLTGCAGLVTLASMVMFPKTFIFFGILHFIALASVLGLLTVRWHRFNLLAGMALITLGLTVSHPWFDRPAWQWVGLMTHKPYTEDYVPLLPWFGVVMIGQFLGRALQSMPAGFRVMTWSSMGPAARLLALSGRHSLLIYMLHQPLLFGLLYLYFR